MLFLLILLKVILYIILTILFLFVLLLVIPFTYSGKVVIADGYRLVCDFGWAWSLLGIEADVSDSETEVKVLFAGKRLLKLGDRPEKAKTPGKPEKEKKEKKEEKSGKKKRGFGLRDFADKELFAEALEYLKALIRIARPKYLQLYGTYGFDDPALTGMTYGAIAMLSPVFPPARLQITPSFGEEVFDIDFEAAGSITAGALAYRTLRTVLKRPVRKILFRKNKK